jgi:putative ABC transport system ATP-binding protein/lipoprotein-releasing system ATP-binding protein
LLPARKAKLLSEKHQYATELLKEFGLQDRMNYFPNQISGGEQQRAAIARALVMKPKYIFADEPTGNLDTKNGQIVIELLQRVNRTTGATIVFVTHEPEYAAAAKRQIVVVDGQIS